MRVRRKSLHRRRNAKQAKKRANQRAAKERKRLARLAVEHTLPDTAHGTTIKLKPSGFRIAIECLDDGERVSFTAARGPHGLTVSPTMAGRKVATVLKYYVPARTRP